MLGDAAATPLELANGSPIPVLTGPDVEQLLRRSRPTCYQCYHYAKPPRTST